MLTVEKLVDNSAEIMKENEPIKDLYFVKSRQDDVEISSLDPDIYIGIINNKNLNTFQKAKAMCMDGITTPNLRSKELLKAYGIALSGNHENILKKILKPGEILEVGTKIKDLSEMFLNQGVEDPVEEVKKK